MPEPPPPPPRQPSPLAPVAAPGCACCTGQPRTCPGRGAVPPARAAAVSPPPLPARSAAGLGRQPDQVAAAAAPRLSRPPACAA